MGRSIQRFEFDVIGAHGCDGRKLRCRTPLTASPDGKCGWVTELEFSANSHRHEITRTTTRIESVLRGPDRVLSIRRALQSQPGNVERTTFYPLGFGGMAWKTVSTARWATRDFRRAHSQGITVGEGWGVDPRELQSFVLRAIEVGDPMPLMDWITEQGGRMAELITGPGWLPETFGELEKSSPPPREVTNPWMSEYPNLTRAIPEWDDYIRTLILGQSIQEARDG